MFPHVVWLVSRLADSILKIYFAFWECAFYFRSTSLATFSSFWRCYCEFVRKETCPAADLHYQTEREWSTRSCPFESSLDRPCHSCTRFLTLRRDLPVQFDMTLCLFVPPSILLLQAPQRSFSIVRSWLRTQASFHTIITMRYKCRDSVSGIGSVNHSSWSNYPWLVGAMTTKGQMTPTSRVS